MQWQADFDITDAFGIVGLWRNRHGEIRKLDDLRSFNRCRIRFEVGASGAVAIASSASGKSQAHLANLQQVPLFHSFLLPILLVAACASHRVLPQLVAQRQNQPQNRLQNLHELNDMRIMLIDDWRIRRDFTSPRLPPIVRGRLPILRPTR